MDETTRLRGPLVAGESLFRGGRRCALWRRRALLWLQVSLRHSIASRRGRHAWMPGCLGGTRLTKIIPPGYLLLPAARRRRVLVFQGLRRVRSARYPVACDRFDRRLP